MKLTKDVKVKFPKDTKHLKWNLKKKSLTIYFNGAWYQVDEKTEIHHTPGNGYAGYCLISPHYGVFVSSNIGRQIARHLYLLSEDFTHDVYKVKYFL